MLTLILDYRLDALLFTLASLGLMVGVMGWLRKRYQIRAFSRRMPILLSVVIILGIIGAELAEKHERRRLTEMLEGIAPTYAQEMQLMGHWKIQPDTPATDPLYLSLIESQKRWLQVNSTVNDIYTIRQLPDGKVILLVDSETDYDHNGAFKGEREERTPIGEVYEPTEEMLKSLAEGINVFDKLAYTDRWGTWVSAYCPLRDPEGKVEGILGVDYDASAWAGSILANRGAALAGSVVLVVILILSSATVQIAQTELQHRIESERQKELLQAELVKASRMAGMAEVAAGVLHNVGNVLNSVNVSAGVVSERLKGSKIPAVGKAADLMQQHANDLPGFFQTDAKAQQLPQFLGKLAKVLSDDQNDMIGELQSLTRSVDHIKQIVASQQTYAKQVDVVETFDMQELIDEAMRINGLSLSHDEIGIEIVKEYESCQPLKMDKHRVLQILVNLASNAKKAVLNETVATRRITCRLLSTETEGKPCLRIEVIDTGVGIPAALLPKIFQHGFTTSEEGHGFGLHSAANDARRMGGSLRAASDGAGCGARFTLELPIATKEVAES